MLIHSKSKYKDKEESFKLGRMVYYLNENLEEVEYIYYDDNVEITSMDIQKLIATKLHYNPVIILNGFMTVPNYDDIEEDIQMLFFRNGISDIKEDVFIEFVNKYNLGKESYSYTNLKDAYLGDLKKMDMIVGINLFLILMVVALNGILT